MNAGPDDTAASPLVVIVTFVVVAALLTVLVYALVFDRPDPDVELVAVRDGEAVSLTVTRAAGGLDWDDLDVRFIDRAGNDRSDAFLQLPTGAVDRLDSITVAPRPPAGTYLVLVLRGPSELSRLAVTL